MKFGQIIVRFNCIQKEKAGLHVVACNPRIQEAEAGVLV